MDFIREIKRIEDNTITIELPGSYKNKEVEILVLPFEDIGKNESAKRRPFESLKEISIDTRTFKFNKEELHER
ncbi:hypothetical protein ACFLQP_02930 [Acidobacteriota bacterium]